MVFFSRTQLRHTAAAIGLQNKRMGVPTRIYANLQRIPVDIFQHKFRCFTVVP